MKDISMHRFQVVGEDARIARLRPFHGLQQLHGKLLDHSGNFEGFDPEILLSGFAENIRPGKGKAPGDGEDIGHVLRFPPAQGTQFVRQDVPPVVDAGIKRRFLKIAIMKRHIIDEVDLQWRLLLASQDPNEGFRGSPQFNRDSTATQGRHGFFNLLPEISRRIDEKIEVVGIAMMEVMPAERCPAREIKRRIRLADKRQDLVHERVEFSRIEHFGHKDSDP